MPELTADLSFIIILVTGPVHMETGQSVSTLYAESKGANGSELAFPCTSSHLSKFECT